MEIVIAHRPFLTLGHPTIGGFQPVATTEGAFRNPRHSQNLDGPHYRCIGKLTTHATLLILSHQTTALAKCPGREMDSLRAMLVNVI